MSLAVAAEKRVKCLLAAQINTVYPNEYQKILIDKSLGRSSRLTRVWQGQWAPDVAPALQPDIDLLYYHKDGRLMATELKYFTLVRRHVNYPYYVGFSQALALMQFGFDHVSLMYVFDKELLKADEKRILQGYGGNAWRFIRRNIDKKARVTKLKKGKKIEKQGVGLDFTCVIFDGTLKGPKQFQVAGINTRTDRLALRKYQSGNLLPLVKWRYKNPLRKSDVAVQFRQFILDNIISK